MTQNRFITAPRMAARTALILFLFVLVFTSLLSGAYVWTRSSIEAAAAEEKMKLIDEVLPRDRYDNKLLDDAAVLDAAFPDRPVWLSRIDGHAGWANTAATVAVSAAPPM